MRKEDISITRREFLKLSALSAVTAGCGLVNAPVEVGTEFNNDPYLKYIYPELSTSVLSQKGEIKGEKSNFIWYNFSDGYVDPRALGDFIGYYDTLSGNGRTYKYDNLCALNDELFLSFNTRHEQNHFLFLLNSNAPRPKWQTKYTSTTIFGSDGGITASVVRFPEGKPESVAPYYGSKNLTFNKALATEIGNSLIEVKSSKPELDYPMQEVVSNSLGELLILKQILKDPKFNFEIIEKLLTENNQCFTVNGKIYSEFLDRELYNSIPELTLPLIASKEK